jgi:hypothetical protein
MLVIDDNSEDSRIRNLNVKLRRRNSVAENAHSKSSQRKKEEESVTVGSHPNFPKERGPSDQTEDAREIYHREKSR